LLVKANQRHHHSGCDTLGTRIIVDSTVQENVVAHPTDSKLLETVRVKLVEAAKA
jgi:hypothetical protein